jgi:hypothetical protein
MVNKVSKLVSYSLRKLFIPPIQVLDNCGTTTNAVAETKSIELPEDPLLALFLLATLTISL